MSTVLEPELQLGGSLDDFIRCEIEELGLRDEQEYFERLAQAEHKRKVQAYYDAKLREAIDEDVWIPATPEFYEKLRAGIKERGQARRREKSA